MSTALHLARIERLCTREFPAAHGSTDPGPGGPGYHLAELAEPVGPAAGSDPGDDDPAQRDVVEEKYEAARDGLSRLLTARWGQQPHRVGLQGVLLRVLEYGEEIPEPWASLSTRAPDVHVWHAAGRWVALGVARLDPARPPRLLVAVTDTDPP